MHQSDSNSRHFDAPLNPDVVTPTGSALCNNHREYGYMAPRDAGIGCYPIQESERLLGLAGS